MPNLDWEREQYLRANAPWTDGDLDGRDRILAEWGRYRVVFGPFGGVPNEMARVVMLGLTPGRSQLKKANEVAREAHHAGITDPRVISAMTRARVAFAGTMRTNAIAMLDDLGLNAALRIGSCSAFFEQGNTIANTSSALRYPVFVRKNGIFVNYGGARSLTREQVFCEMLEHLLAPELNAAPDALIVPFGPAVESVLDHLSSKDRLDPERVLRGFPHPSGGNGHRARLFTANRAAMREAIRAWFR